MFVPFELDGPSSLGFRWIVFVYSVSVRYSFGFRWMVLI